MKSRSATIRRYGKTLSALILSLTLTGGVAATSSVFAASDDATSSATQQEGKSSKGAFGNFGKRGGGQGQAAHGFKSSAIESKIADYLKLSLADLREKQQTQTLAEIAASLNVSRDTLKAQLVAWIEAERPANSSSSSTPNEDKPAWDAAAIADKMLDSKGAALKGDGLKGKGGSKVGFGFRIAADELASLIGITADQLKEEQEAGKTVAEIAEAHGVMRDALKTKLVAWLDAHKPAAPAADADSSATTDTKKQPDWDSSAIADRILDSGPGKDGGHGRGFEGVRGGFGFRAAYDSAAVASVLGVTEDELKTALAAGKTIADVASSKGVAVDKVQQAIVAALTAKLDAELSSGAITQEQYDKQADQLSVIAEKIVNSSMPAGKQQNKRGHQADNASNSASTDTSA
ncbi:hypothetical protein PCCS19_28470 [Paenibacillus sp. CCS19]|uniref:hypothetical protein n=1 Tax=Paenibacillus sp. CCS19 TaxID=3158387 RepID=UPI0025621DB4|nr:hypothetical protein [Paenibacillus cellulosilyticus]GMK39792.1 hypothetical protein PCCS19_28470 [Paenibacillus cellulosilyticus]